MKNKIKSIAVSMMLLASIATNSVMAATPDGAGPWADEVVLTNQGLMKNGDPVPAVRSDATSALGVAENDTVDGHFYSLGFGGTMTLGFENGISSGVIVVEATNLNYPIETAKVEVSSDNSTWVEAGNVAQDGEVSVPTNAGCVNYVRVMDTSDPAIFEDETADGYDVDGVAAQGNSCTNEGRMTGGGSVFKDSGDRVTHGFELNCNAQNQPNNLQINWGRGNKFHLTELLTALCTDDPAIDQGNPKAPFDTYKGSGIGKFNGSGGYKAEWIFTDAGEGGKQDTARIVIKSPADAVILTVSGQLKNGNQQAH